MLKIARKINRNVDFPGFSKSFIRLSANPHRKLRILWDFLSKPFYVIKVKSFPPQFQPIANPGIYLCHPRLSRSIKSGKYDRGNSKNRHAETTAEHYFLLEFLSSFPEICLLVIRFFIRDKSIAMLSPYQPRNIPKELNKKSSQSEN